MENVQLLRIAQSLSALPRAPSRQLWATAPGNGQSVPWTGVVWWGSKVQDGIINLSKLKNDESNSLQP